MTSYSQPTLSFHYNHSLDENRSILSDDRIFEFLTRLACLPLPLCLGTPASNLHPSADRYGASVQLYSAFCKSAPMRSWNKEGARASMRARPPPCGCGNYPASMWRVESLVFANLRRAALETGNCPWLLFSISSNAGLHTNMLRAYQG